MALIYKVENRELVCVVSLASPPPTCIGLSIADILGRYDYNMSYVHRKGLREGPQIPMDYSRIVILIPWGKGPMFNGHNPTVFNEHVSDHILHTLREFPDLKIIGQVRIAKSLW